MLKKLLILPALAIGVVAVMLMVKGKSGPEVRPPQEQATTVRVLQVPRTPVVPRAIGYGEARAGRVWQAVPQVGGRIIELSPRVKEGTFVQSGTVLVRIDPSDYELDVKVAEARIAALRAQLRETNTREEATRTSLGIERESLALADTELERIRSLVKKGTVPGADLDREDRTVLTQKLRVQEIENSLTMLPPQREVIEAQIAQEASNLKRTQLNVGRTVIRAPFHCRMGPVGVEQDQVVQAGQVLFSADSTDTSEVTAWLPLRGMRQVLSAGTAEIDAISGNVDIPKQLNLRANIRVAAGAHAFTWKGEVVRVRGIDSQTRSLGLDVAVPDPYKNIIPGLRPPLVPDLYVEVEILAEARPDLVVVPRSALHDDVVYLVGENKRLVLQPVVVSFVQEEIAVIGEGLQGGESLVLTDVIPAVAGALLVPKEDASAREALLESATRGAVER